MAEATVILAPGKVVNLSVTVNPRHHDMVEEIRRAEAIAGGVIPNKSDVVKQAIEGLAREKLDPERFAQLMGTGS